MRIGVIGTGTISSAVVEGIAQDEHVISVSERNAARSARLAALFPNVSVKGNQAVLDDSDVVILGVMAHVMPAVLDELSFRSDHRVISLAAGMGLAEVAKMVASARSATIAIPFPGIASGGSPIMVQGECSDVQALFGLRNKVFAIGSDAEMNAYLSAQAVLSPAVKLVGDAADWLGSRVSDPAQAEAFLRLLVGSSLLGSECAPLLDALNTPGGFNQRLREHMVAHGMSEAVASGLDRLEQDG